jgi:sterol desaturase/sphingolipid hydroxylase (fatty acid hydroxylase superfamily)
MEIGSSAGKFGFLVFLAFFVMLEALWLIYARKRDYELGHTVASFGVAFIKRVVDTLTAGVAAGLLFWVYEYRIFTLRMDGPWMWLLAFVSVEFAYYWHHRWAHEIRWLWATHGVHHTAPYMNLSVAGRLGWTGLLSGTILFFTPLAFLGFHPLVIFFLLAAGLFYQIWIHTELVPRLGPLERLFNTPSNHRVHHGSNPEYLDKNYGGVLIIFDRLFGTYASEGKDDPVVYGTVQPMESKNPFMVGFFEWINIAQDVVNTKSVREGFMYMFGPPGWRKDDIDKTEKLTVTAKIDTDI